MPPPSPKPVSSVQVSRVAGRANSLGLDDGQVQEILDQLDGPTGEPAQARRVNTRLPFRATRLVIVVEQPGGKSVLNVVCRNLSRGGLGVLHSSYLHTGGKCACLLRHRTRGEISVAGTIVRCRHVLRNIHEVGVKFAEPINVEDFVAIDYSAGLFSREAVDAAKLTGNVLAVADYSIDRALIKHQLDGTALVVQYANSVQDAITYVKSNPVDIVVTDFDLGTSGTGADLMAQLRSAGVKVPVIVMSADGSAATRQAVREAKAEALLIKPVPRADLLRAIAEFLPEPVETAPCVELTELGAEFAKGLPALAEDMEQCQMKGDAQGFLRTCSRVTATASSLGIAPLAAAGEATIKAVSASNSVKESGEQIGAFLAACRRVTPAAAKAA